MNKENILEEFLNIGRVQFKLYEGEVLTEEELKLLASTPFNEILYGLELAAAERLKLSKGNELNNLTSNIKMLNYYKNQEDNKKVR